MEGGMRGNDGIAHVKYVLVRFLCVCCFAWSMGARFAEGTLEN